MKPINKQQIFYTIILALYAGIMVGALVNAMGELYGITILQQQLSISKTEATNIYPWLFAGIAIGGPLHGYFSNRLRVSPPRWMLLFCIISFLLYLIQLQFYHLKIHSSAFVSLFFLTGLSVSSMLLAFSWSREIYPKYIHARAFALINMIIALCGYQFQQWVGIMENYSKKNLSMRSVNQT